MEQTTLEAIPFLWGVSFAINALMAICLFMMIIRRATPPWLSAPLMWVAWWTMANAMSLIINAVLGPSNTFSYHQMGILTESMVNLGVCVWAVSYLLYNWNMSGEKKWEKMDALRRELNAEGEDAPK